jgi:hypothetical protein
LGIAEHFIIWKDFYFSDANATFQMHPSANKYSTRRCPVYSRSFITLSCLIWIRDLFLIMIKECDCNHYSLSRDEENT